MQRVVSNRFPYLPLTLQIGQRTHTVQALLDTGFDGDVIVPSTLIAAQDPVYGYDSWTLADGSSVSAAAYVATIQVGTLAPFSVLVTALGDEPLVGRGVSDRFSITLDHGERVIVEP